MRLGELRNILDLVAYEDDTIKYDVENRYDGKRFFVKNFSNLIEALTQLSKQSWVKDDTSIVKELNKEYGGDSKTIEISPEQHNSLSTLINSLNTRLPVFYGLINTIVDEQDEQIVNIKLPVKNIKDLDSLNEFNKELQEVFKLVVKHHGFGGDIKFEGLDVGTSWYKILIVGHLFVYPAFIESINIAHELISLRKEWYESENTRIDVEIKEQKLATDITDADIVAYVDEKIDKKLEKKVESLLKETLDKEETKEETISSIKKGIKKAISLIEKGTEFHVSLNPPKYVLENNGGYSIDYKQMRRLIEETNKEKNAPKLIEDNYSEKAEDDKTQQ